MADPFEAIAEPVQTQGSDPFAQIAEPAQPPTPSAPPQKPSLWSRVTADYNPEVQNRNPVVRFLDQAGGNLLALPQNIYRAFSAPLTPEEQAEFKGHTRIPGEVGVERLTGAPIVRAAQTYANPETRPTLQQAVGVLPEALGAAAGQYAGGELAGRATGKVVKTIGELRNAVENVQGTARKVTGVEPALKKEVADTAAGHAEDLAKAEADRQAGAAKIEQQKSVDQQSAQLGKQVEQVEAAVGKEADAKFKAVREKIGDQQANPQPLIDAVTNAETNILQGIPENVKEFRSILGHGEEAPAGLAKDFENVTGRAPEGALPVTWDKLQSLKSRIDARLRGADRSRMNGDLKRSLYSVRDAVVDQMGAMAEQNGAGQEWAGARDFYRQYKEDFHEPSGPSGSGSPVAAAFNAVDPKQIRQPFIAKQSGIGNRAVDTLRKYPEYGGTEAAQTAEGVLQSHQELGYMPKKNPNAPNPAEPVVDVQQVARDAIAKRASRWGDFNARDIGVIASSGIGGPILWALGERSLGGALLLPALYEGGKFAASRVLNNPKVVEWLSRTPPEEAAVLAKIPGADRVKIMDGLTRIATQSGKRVQLSPQAMMLLGPSNVRQILASNAALSTGRIKNPMDAKEALQPVQP